MLGCSEMTRPKWVAFMGSCGINLAVFGSFGISLGISHGFLLLVPKSKAGARQYIFNLTVAPPPPPVVKVVGPSSVSDACSFRDLDQKLEMWLSFVNVCLKR